MSKIPKIFFQTGKNQDMEKYVLDMIKMKLTDDWTYKYFNDLDVIDFFIRNPLEEFPNVIDKFNSFKNGAHRADLFRYYFLYINGGFFLDSDAMIYENIDTIVKDYEFVSVKSSVHPNTIFQGVLGTTAKNKIIKEALVNAYETAPEVLNRYYHHFCNQLYLIVKKYDDKNIKLYNEYRCDGVDYIIDENNELFNSRILLFKHYWQNKIIPFPNMTNWNNYNRSELNLFDYRILTTYEIINSNKLVRIGPSQDGGYVILDGLNYDLFISCGIGHDVKFEDAFLDKYKDIDCIMFDGTISQLPPHRNKFNWCKKNIGVANTNKTTNLKEYLQEYDTIFLKMDIEGSEFNWLDTLDIDELSKFSQIVMEVHWPFDLYRSQMLSKLNATHYIIHIHGNNYCDRDIPKHLPSGRTYDGTVTIRNAYLKEIKLPEVLEITYINKRLIEPKEIRKKEIKFPTNLDSPNNPFAQDISFSIPIN